ncbi:MAG: outer membrane protein assembly factor BamB [Gammaproteobacteria bacterium]
MYPGVRLSSGCLRTLLLAAVLTAGSISTAGCSLFGGDDDEPDAPVELPDFKSTIKIKKVWSAGLGDETEFLRLALAPASDGSRIFAAANDGRVSAFEAVKGKRLWLSKTGLQLSGGPATDGKVVVLGTSNGEVIALAADDGRELWRKSLSSEVLAAPAIAPGLVLVRTVDGKLTALAIADGAQRWFVQQNMPRLTVRGTGSPVVVQNVVVCGFDNGKLAAYELADGTPAWDTLLDPPSGRNEIERLADINATVRSVGDDIYLVGYGGVAAAVALESGQTLWTQEVAGYGGLATDLENVYVSGIGSEMYALVRQTGSELWKHELLKNRDITGPAAYQSSVVVGDFEGYIHFFDAATGKPQARVRLHGSRVTSAPLVVNDLLYVQSDGGKLAAYRQVAKK